MVNINRSYRILNLEGSWFDLEENNYTFNTMQERTYKCKNGKEIKIKPNKNKLYSATMPYSLETIRAFNKLPNEILLEGEEQFTNLFVNFKFTKDKIFDTENDDECTKIKKKELRQKIYTSIVIIDGIEYCYFKRGASKARTANVIFCKKKHYDELYNPCLLGLKFEIDKEYDITSKEAYVSLIMSGIIGTIEIKPEEILIINDIKSPNFKANQTLTIKDTKGNISQIENKFDVVNNMTDGQALMDESVYIENELLNKATCALLRNDFLKANACRTRLQEYWKENNITKVWDMYRGWIDCSSIKLVITPSSCKYLKFSDQFESEKECFEDWLNRIPSTFGVVKIDHMGNYGYSNRLSYQMLNSMNLNKDNELLNLMDDELKYYKFLKDNTLASSSDIKKMTKRNKEINREMRNKMSYFLDLVSNSKEEELSTSDMIDSLLKRNNDFKFTKNFKDWKKEQLQDYIANLRLGKVRIKNSIYAIMISCPYEMLVVTTKENNKIDNCIMDGWECYCPTFGENKKLMAIRNPQINEGNIACLNNKWHDEYKYFGYYNEEGKAKYDFVVFINSWNADVMNRLQGCDWDIDSIYLTDNQLLVSKAEDSQKWATPTNGIKGDDGENNKKYLNYQTLANLDNYLGGSTMSIGKIVNKSAVFNSYMYHAINNNYPQNYIDKCYEASSTLSSFSQIAIDMAKKNFKGLSLTTEMNKLNKKCYIDDEGKEKKILEYEIDRENISKITLENYIKDVIKKDNDKNYIVKYELVSKIDNIDALKQEYLNYKQTKTKETVINKKFLEKIEVHESKMIVPYFFTYVAKNNSYRIPRYMDCSMDYLEKILDDLDTKARQTDKINIQDLLIMQKELDGREFDRKKVDEVRKIIDICQSIQDKNYYDKTDNEHEERQKSNLRRWAKKDAIEKLKELKLNEKTVYRILLRAFGLDKNYEGVTIYHKDKEGNIITYFDYGNMDEDDEWIEFISTVKELKEMTMLTLTLMYYSYPDSFLKCFEEKKAEDIKVHRFWI